MSILFKAVAGLAAGVVAGGLGLAFLPRLEPSALKPRSAVEKPQFVVATDASPTSPEPSATLAVAAEPKTPPAPLDKVAPATPQMVALRPAAPLKPEVQAAPPTRPAPVASPTGAPGLANAPTGAPGLANAPTGAPGLANAPTGSLGLANSPTGAPGLANAPTGSLGLANSPTVAPGLANAPSGAPLTSLVAPTRPLAPNKPAPQDAARWSVSGLVALAKGDLSHARLFLTRAAEAGDARAWVALADAYDPAMLAKLGVMFAPGDAQRARDCLVKAMAAGVVVPRDRLAALDSATQPAR